jgi:predicted transcriptional regulator
MPELKFDRPVPELTDEADAQTLAAIAEGIAQLDAGQGIPIEEVRGELARRCSK